MTKKKIKPGRIINAHDITEDMMSNRQPILTIKIEGGRRKGKSVLQMKLAKMLSLLGNDVFVLGDNRHQVAEFIKNPSYPNDPRTIHIIDKE